MNHTISLASILAVFWLANSGHYSPLLLALGAASVALVCILAHRMHLVARESQPLHLVSQVPGYWSWLLKEMATANLDVVYRVWRGNDAISPTQVVVRASQKTDVGEVIYANSITLTPGTVVMELAGSELTVHALTREAAEALEGGEMDRRVSRIEV